MAWEQHELTFLHPVPGVLFLVLLHIHILTKEAEKNPNKQTKIVDGERQGDSYS